MRRSGASSDHSEIEFNYPDVGGPDTYRFLRSRDLVKWEETSSLPHWFECPEFIPMKSAVAGEDLVLFYGCCRSAKEDKEPFPSNSCYQLGRFDGQTHGEGRGRFYRSRCRFHPAGGRSLADRARPDGPAAVVAPRVPALLNPVGKRGIRDPHRPGKDRTLQPAAFDLIQQSIALPTGIAQAPRVSKSSFQGVHKRSRLCLRLLRSRWFRRGWV